MANFVFIIMGYDSIRNSFFKLLQLMDKTTANVVGPRTLGVVASVLASGVQTDTTTPNMVGTCSELWEGYNPKTL